MVARLLVGLTQQNQDKGVLEISFLQIVDRSFIVSSVKGNITGKVGKEAGLIGIIGFVEGGFGGCDVLLGFVSLAPAGGDAGLCVLPAEEPEVSFVVGNLGFAHGRVVSHAIPLESMIGVTGFEINAGHLIGDSPGAGKIILAQTAVKHLLL